ncbi:MAG: pilus assembly PilX N-terminal domain-containing protein, partial [Candidatus Saccharimonadales bacterium]
MKTITMTQSNQRDRGFVSILVTMILMVVTSLIVLSFAFLARQNQTRNLNQQLSTQAFYAAESGINDAVVQIKANPAFNNTDCGQTTKIGAQTIGDASLNVSYTCVLVNQSPTDLKYDNISTDSSTVVHIHVNNPGILQISWQDASKPPTASSFVTDLAGRPFNLPQTSVTGGQLFNLVNNAGILRTTVIPTANAQQLDGDSLLNNSRNFFLYPYGTTAPNSAGSANMSAADGSFVDGHCSASTTAYQFACNVQIGLVGNDFYVRLKSIYRASAVDIKVLGNDQVPQAITGAQAVIDATGKAQNVLRRVQVRLPLTAAYYYPEFGLESGDTICKRFSVWQTGASVLTPTDT